VQPQQFSRSGHGLSDTLRQGLGAHAILHSQHAGFELFSNR
jgi:hypothetical protein